MIFRRAGCGTAAGAALFGGGWKFLPSHLPETHILPILACCLPARFCLIIREYTNKISTAEIVKVPDMAESITEGTLKSFEKGMFLCMYFAR